MFNFDITKGRSGISALLASLAIVVSGVTFSGAVLAQPSGAAVSSTAEAPAAAAPVAPAAAELHAALSCIHFWRGRREGSG